MRASRVAKLKQQLTSAEAELRSRLAVLLPRVEVSGESIFFNSAHAPATWEHVWSPPEAEPIFLLASECMLLREQLALPSTESLAAAFIAACVEASGNSAQRRGPRTLASSLRSQMSADAV
jgi:hypothetical protein